jgi:hypothetical protein
VNDSKNNMSLRPDGDSARERLNDLLVDRATVGLGAAEEAELQLLAHELGERIDESLERTAAKLTLATIGLPGTYAAMPAELYQKLAAQGDAWSRQSAEPMGMVGGGSDLPSLMEGLEPRGEVVARIGFFGRAVRTFPTWGGWATAAATLTIVGVMGGRPSGSTVTVANNQPAANAATTTVPAVAPTLAVAKPAPVVVVEPEVVALPVAKVALAPSPVEGLDRLVSSAGEVLKVSAVASAALEHPEQVSAEFIWSERDSRGFLAVAGLPATDSERQYQVWVRDSARGEPHAINGGTFDIASDGPRWVIPIEPILPVYRPAVFEVTVEQAGGVVVSSPERVILTGTVAREDDVHGPPSWLAGPSSQ